MRVKQLRRSGHGKVKCRTAPEQYGDAVADTVAQAATALAERTGVARHDAVVVLGSGWDAATEVLGTLVAELPVAELPGFLAPVAPGHRGLVRSYDLDGVAVLAYLGRTHLYEGHGPAPVAHPVRVAAAAGARVRGAHQRQRRAARRLAARHRRAASPTT